MSATEKRKSTKADDKVDSVSRQRVDAAAFADRLKAAMAWASVAGAELARKSGVSAQLVSEYGKGQKVAGADNLFALADALGVSPRWLLRGEGAMTLEAGEESITLQRYDLSAIQQDGKDPAEELTIPRILLSSLRSPAGVWVAYMPSDTMPSVAREGDLVLCSDPETPLQDRRVYAFNLDGRVIVRRVMVRPDGLVLKGEADEDTITVRPDEAESLFPVARVLGPLGFNPA